MEVFVKLSRSEESTIYDLQQRLDSLERHNWHLEHQVRNLKRSDEIQKRIAVVELAFNDRCKRGVNQVNRFLKKGFSINYQVHNDAGIVVELVKWGPKEFE